MITRILSGHNNLKSHMIHLNYCENDFCSYCMEMDPENYQQNTGFEAETGYHLLMDCLQFSAIRNEIYGTTEITAQQIQSDSPTSRISKLIKFLKKSQILSKKIDITKSMISPKKKENTTTATQKNKENRKNHKIFQNIKQKQST